MSAAIVWRTLGGAACGAIAGFVLMTVHCDVIEGARNIWCVLAGALMGVPIGAAVGVVIAGRRWTVDQPEYPLDLSRGM